MLRKVSPKIGAASLAGMKGRDALRVLFDLGLRCVSEIDLPEDGVCGTARSLTLAFPNADGIAVHDLVEIAERDHPLVLKAPFEQTESIAGGVWSASELVDTSRDDGLVKLRFNRGTLDLPMHVHEFSDRFILVLEGEGFFHVSSETLGGFSGRDVRCIPVTAGEALAFTRGLLHTFSSPAMPLLLLSYHAPLVELDDPGQYTLPKMIWTPRNMHGYHRESRGVSVPDVR
ncbi:MAG: hypothetical protein IT449_07230 [Phycisphaerales bacterium]|nr:hypothetical protein [Phycisphaerales bacterium]